jgi:ABC transporter substrate binding protein
VAARGARAAGRRRAARRCSIDVREVQSWIRELVQRLQELGWTNGRNVRVDFRFSDADAARTSMLATELIELRPDVVLASGALAATALRQQTLSIPIVFVHVVDPVLPASSPTWHGRRAISPASPISSFRSEGSGCSCLRNARPVLTELRWFLIRPIRHGLHICARLRLPHHRSAYG